MDLFISPCSSISFCLKYFDALLLGAYTLKIFMSSWKTDSFYHSIMPSLILYKFPCSEVCFNLFAFFSMIGISFQLGMWFYIPLQDVNKLVSSCLLTSVLSWSFNRWPTENQLFKYPGTMGHGRRNKLKAQQIRHKSCIFKLKNVILFTKRFSSCLCMHEMDRAYPCAGEVQAKKWHWFWPVNYALIWGWN